MYGGLRAKGEKPELALVGCDVDATVAGEVSVFNGYNMTSSFTSYGLLDLRLW
jgi:hypothetical protein